MKFMNAKNQKNIISVLLLSAMMASLPVGAYCNEEQTSHIVQGISQESAPSELYYFQLNNIELPYNLLEKYTSGTWFTDPSIYIEVKRNGNDIFRSSSKKVERKENSFSFNDNSNFSFATFFKKGDVLEVKLFAAPEENISRVENAGLGAAGAGAVGATIGAVACGILTGGFGAPLGGIIGGLIGGALGGSAGALVPVDGSQEISTFVYDSPTEFFVKKQEIAKRHPKDILDTKTSKTSLCFKGYALSKNEKKAKELEQQKNYVVQIRELYLPIKTSGVIEEGEYYAILKNGEEEKKFELGKIPSNQKWILPENFFVLKNKGFKTSLEIKRKKWFKDPVVFFAEQGNGDVSSWLFIGKVVGENATSGSWVEFKTMEAINGISQR